MQGFLSGAICTNDHPLSMVALLRVPCQSRGGHDGVLDSLRALLHAGLLLSRSRRGPGVAWTWSPGVWSKLTLGHNQVKHVGRRAVSIYGTTCKPIASNVYTPTERGGHNQTLYSCHITPRFPANSISIIS
jgi:hypothetical protein